MAATAARWVRADPPQRAHSPRPLASLTAPLCRWSAFARLQRQGCARRLSSTAVAARGGTAAAHSPTAAASSRIGALGFPLPEHVASKLVAYPSTVTIPIQWGHQDGYGHVNNVREHFWLRRVALRVRTAGSRGLPLAKPGSGLRSVRSGALHALS